jgi:uncharacterized protein (TIGR03435 family)
MKLLYGTVLFAAIAAGQTKPEFEVASVKPSADAPMGSFNMGVHIDGAQVRVNHMSLRDYVVMAYRLKPYQFSGPDWMGAAYFDISAKLPQGATREQFGPMMQSLLEDRFHLKAHRSNKEFNVYALTVGKGGPKLTESAPMEATTSGVTVEVQAAASNATVNLGNGKSLALTDNKFEARRFMTADFVDQLSRFGDRPVIDMTGLTGTYDLTLEFQPDDFLILKILGGIAAGIPMPPQALKLLENASDAPLLAAIQALGLKLESRKAPLEIVVVDGALKTPTEN